MKRDIQEEVIIPEGIQSSLEGNTLTLKGPKGEWKHELTHPKIKWSQKENTLVIEVKNATKRENRVVNALKAHTKNALQGIQEPYTYKLKVCSGHFPITVSYKDDKLEVKNLFGEKIPRVLNIKYGVEVKVEGDQISVTSSNKEHVSQVAADIENVTKRPGFDQRVFQDGCYIIAKGDKEIK